MGLSLVCHVPHEQQEKICVWFCACVSTEVHKLTTLNNLQNGFWPHRIVIEQNTDHKLSRPGSNVDFHYSCLITWPRQKTNINRKMNVGNFLKPKHHKAVQVTDWPQLRHVSNCTPLLSLQKQENHRTLWKLTSNEHLYKAKIAKNETCHISKWQKVLLLGQSVEWILMDMTHQSKLWLMNIVDSISWCD